MVRIDLPNCKVELFRPLGERSPFRSFLDKTPNGASHRKRDDERKIAAHGNLIPFQLPKDVRGILAERDQANSPRASVSATVPALGILTGLAVYLVVWWLVLFMVLPWGVRGVDTSDIAKGHAAGAPKKPRVLLKIAATTVISAIVWYGLYLLAEADWVTFRE